MQQFSKRLSNIVPSVNHSMVNSLGLSDAYMRQLTYHHWFRQWLVAWTAPSHYMNQCWNDVDWNLRNKHQWNISQNSCIFFQENAFENVIWEMAAILSRPQCVKTQLSVNHVLYSHLPSWMSFIFSAVESVSSGNCCSCIVIAVWHRRLIYGPLCEVTILPYFNSLALGDVEGIL